MMNWLAHLFLAEANPESRLGNLLGDLVKGVERQSLAPSLQRGLKCHQEIDIFTDGHLIVKRSKRRIDTKYSRFAGILIDVFYDYILANHWQDYSDIPLTKFTAVVYASWTDYIDSLPDYAQGVIRRLIEEDWLSSYSSLEGIENTLVRISWKLSRRRNRQFDLSPAKKELTQNYAELEQDFQQFFPQLISYIDHWHLSTN